MAAQVLEACRQTWAPPVHRSTADRPLLRSGSAEMASGTSRVSGQAVTGPPFREDVGWPWPPTPRTMSQVDAEAHTLLAVRRTISMLVSAGTVWAGLTVVSGWLVRRPVHAFAAGIVALLVAAKGRRPTGMGATGAAAAERERATATTGHGGAPWPLRAELQTTRDAPTRSATTCPALSRLSCLGTGPVDG